MHVLYMQVYIAFGRIPSFASPCCARWTETREIDTEAYVYTAIPYKLHWMSFSGNFVLTACTVLKKKTQTIKNWVWELSNLNSLKI